MGLPFFLAPPIDCGDPGELIPYGCSLEGSQYFSRAFASPLTDAERRTFVISFWLKRYEIGSSSLNTILSTIIDGNTQENIVITQGGKDEIGFGDRSAGTWAFHSSAVGALRDPAAHSHIFVKYDSTQAVESERIQVFVNGVKRAQVSASGRGYGSGPGAGSNLPPQNHIGQIGRSGAHYIGALTSGSLQLKGILSEFVMLWGAEASASNPIDFGYSNSDGHWMPKIYSGAYGANGFRLNFADAGNLGKDVSGNNNHWTAVNLTDKNRVRDTPSNNMPTLTPLAVPVSGTVQGGRKWATNTGAFPAKTVAGMAIPREGSWRWKIKLSGSFGNQNGATIGLLGRAETNLARVNNACTEAVLWDSRGQVFLNGVQSAGATFTTGDEIVVSYDTKAKRVDFYKLPSNVPAVSVANVPALDWFAAATDQTTAAQPVYEFDFGVTGFSHAPTEGMSYLSAAALPCPAILKPDEHFTMREVAAGASVTDLAWSPLTRKTLVVSMRLDATANRRIVDTVQGVQKAWASNTNGKTVDEADGLTAFTANGYTIGVNAAYQGNRLDLIWGASPLAGFDIIGPIAHTNGTATTVNHAVGGVIEYAWVHRADANQDKRVYHHKLAAGQYLRLNSNAAAATDAGWFGSTANQLTLGASMPTGSYFIYAWRGISQFSCFDLGQGNSSTDGALAPYDFVPAMALVKPTTIADEHRVLWKMPSKGNPIKVHTRLSTSEVQSLLAVCDFTSAGVKFRDSNQAWNGAASYARAAWAGAPAKFARGQ